MGNPWDTGDVVILRFAVNSGRNEIRLSSLLQHHPKDLTKDIKQPGMAQWSKEVALVEPVICVFFVCLSLHACAPPHPQIRPKETPENP